MLAALDGGLAEGEQVGVVEGGLEAVVLGDLLIGTDIVADIRLVEDAGEVDGAVAGCCALRPLDNSDYPNAAEMKRLYVRKAFRGFGLGQELAEGTLDAARRAGYACVLLDTLDEMESARALYASLGFEEIPPYYHNPLPGSHYLKVDID